MKKPTCATCCPSLPVICFVWISRPAFPRSWYLWTREPFTMMTSSNGNISTLLALCEGNPPFTGGFLSQRPVTPSFDASLICTWTNIWTKNRDAGDLRRQCAHCNVTSMIWRSHTHAGPELGHWCSYCRWFCTGTIPSHHLAHRSIAVMILVFKFLSTMLSLVSQHHSNWLRWPRW